MFDYQPGQWNRCNPIMHTWFNVKWPQCFWFVEDFSEDNLHEIDTEICRVRQLYEQKKDMFDKIKHREQLWLRFLQLEVCWQMFSFTIISKHYCILLRKILWVAKIYLLKFLLCRLHFVCVTLLKVSYDVWKQSPLGVQHSITQVRNPWAGPDPWTCYIQPSQQNKRTRNLWLQ